MVSRGNQHTQRSSIKGTFSWNTLQIRLDDSMQKWTISNYAHGLFILVDIKMIYHSKDGQKFFLDVSWELFFGKTQWSLGSVLSTGMLKVSAIPEAQYHLPPQRKTPQFEKTGRFTGGHLKDFKEKKKFTCVWITTRCQAVYIFSYIKLRNNLVHISSMYYFKFHNNPVRKLRFREIK